MSATDQDALWADQRLALPERVVVLHVRIPFKDLKLIRVARRGRQVAPPVCRPGRHGR